MTMLLLLAFFQSVPDEATLNDGTKQIQWARTVSEAFDEAKLRNVPVLFFLTSDN